jgi:hypothetical protein
VWPVAAVALGGVLGVSTLPHFAVAFGAVVAALLALGVQRTRVALAFVLVAAASLAWYAPHVDDVFASTQDLYAVQLESSWILTASIDQTLVPAARLLGDAYLFPNLASLAFVALFAVVMWASPLLRDRATAAVLCMPVVATIAVFWVASAHAAPRFFSFLLVPLFVLVATGAATALGRAFEPRRGIPTVCTAALLAIFAAGSVPFLARIPTEPREAMREVARAIDELGMPMVHAYVAFPQDLEFHLGREVVPARTQAALARACAEPGEVVVVTQIWMLEPLRPECAGRQGARRVRFEQYARGEAIDLWILPPRDETT